MTTPLPKLQPPRVTQGVDPMNTKASNLPLEWKNWLMKFNIYLKAYSLDKEPDDRQVAILLHFMGQDCLTIFNSFNLDVNTVKLEELTKKFTHYFSPKVNITMERHKLFNRKQTLHEDLDNYVTDLRNIALQYTLEPGNFVLADRGFKHVESILDAKGIKLLRPPSVASGSKLSKSQVRETKIIASLRIHIERVIRRVREFHMLKQHSMINKHFLRILNDVIVIARALINLQDSLIK
ncbi:hypothetical protein ACJJTC_009718 [Scirpophaga incertulas]